jgi:protein tyrosine/serine phosphatase
MQQMSDRVVALEGVRNFRDFGGYRADGGAVRRGRLFRSAHFAEASPQDAARLDALDVRVIVDLRRPQERMAQPSRWPLQGQAEILADHDGPPETTEAPHIAFLRQPDLSAEAVDRFMIGLYRAFPFEARHRRLYGAYVRALADGEGASVVHCAAGKDRTGLICALVLRELGVHRDDVLEDYLLTNTVAHADGRAEQVRAMIEQHLGRSLDRDAILPMLGVRTAFLEAALEAIGDVDRYLEDALGIDTHTRQRLKDRLIA